MLEKIKNAGKIAVQLIWTIVVALVMYAITIVKVLRGTASRYTGARHYGGQKFGVGEFLTSFGVYQLPQTIVTDQGVIAAVHGLPGHYLIGGVICGEEVLSQVFPQGKMILVSCCNGTHRDHSQNGRVFVRDRNTISEYSSVLLLSPWGDFYTWGGKGVDIYSWLLRGEFRIALAVARS